MNGELMDHQHLANNGYVVHIRNASLNHSGCYICYGEKIKRVLSKKVKFIAGAQVKIFGE